MQNNPQDAVQFTYESAERIASVVRTAELTPQATRPLSFGKIPPAGKVKLIRAATFTGSWSVNASKVVQFTNTPASTASVQNLTFSLPFTATQSCIVGRDGTNWYLVSALDDQVKRGTFTAPWTKSTSKTVTLASGGTVTSLNDYASIAGTGTKKCTVGRDGSTWHLIAAECT